MKFNGSGAGETIGISSSLTHFLFTRDVANITMNGSAVERIEFRALGGADTISVGDLTTSTRSTRPASGPA